MRAGRIIVHQVTACSGSRGDGHTAMKKYSAFAAGIFGFLAAIFWFLSAYGPLPPMLSYWDGAPAFDPLYASMKFSAHMNTFAAVLSGCSALSTVASLVAR